MKEIHFTKKDFKLEWFSGTGKGGQHRNKHQNCCRITHIETGFKTQGTGSRSRVANQKDAFEKMAALLISYFGSSDSERITYGKVIRSYHCVRNEVHDKASGLKQQYKEVVINGDISDMVDARRIAVLAKG